MPKGRGIGEGEGIDPQMITTEDDIGVIVRKRIDAGTGRDRDRHPDRQTDIDVRDHTVVIATGKIDLAETSLEIVEDTTREIAEGADHHDDHLADTNDHEQRSCSI